MKSALRIVIGSLFILSLAPSLASAQVFGGGPGGLPSTPTVDVTDTCTVTAADSGGVVHTTTYSGSFLGICALVSAEAQGVISSYEFEYFSFGLMLTSLNGIAADPSTEYWQLFQNDPSESGPEAQVGLSSMTIQSGDTLTFQLADFTNGNQPIGSPVSFKIGKLTSTAPSEPVSTTGAGGLSLHDPFNIPMALYFLRSKQNVDGSFDTAVLDDWIAIASAGGGAGDLQKALIAYEAAHPFSLTSVTDYERHAMALEALDINPYSGNGVDYITPIVKSFDGTQIGDPQLINDDIFAIFPLLHAGYTANDDIIQKAIANIVAKQGSDGSWMESVDMTAAAIQALELAPSQPGVSDALRKAEHYLHSQQKDDGSFGNADSTSWMVQAIAALGETVFDWDPSSYHMPDYYLATLQQEDGGVMDSKTDLDTRLWATAYAIPGIEHKTWDQLLANFSKPAPIATTTTEVASTTEATTTPISATVTTPDAASPAAQSAPISISQSNASSSVASSSDASSTDATDTIATDQAAAAGLSTNEDWMSIFPLLIILIIIAAASLMIRNNNRSN